jgi:hypothetical protein
MPVALSLPLSSVGIEASGWWMMGTSGDASAGPPPLLLEQPLLVPAIAPRTVKPRAGPTHFRNDMTASRN